MAADRDSAQSPADAVGAQVVVASGLVCFLGGADDSAGGRKRREGQFLIEQILDMAPKDLLRAVSARDGQVALRDLANEERRIENDSGDGGKTKEVQRWVADTRWRRRQRRQGKAGEGMRRGVVGGRSGQSGGSWGLGSSSSSSSSSSGGGSGSGSSSGKWWRSFR